MELVQDTPEDLLVCICTHIPGFVEENHQRSVLSEASSIWDKALQCSGQFDGSTISSRRRRYEMKPQLVCGKSGNAQSAWECHLIISDYRFEVTVRTKLPLIILEAIQSVFVLELHVLGSLLL